MLLLNILYLLLSGAALIFSGTYLIKTLEKISRILRISKFAVAFIIMAIATSLPEMFVGVSSAIQKTPSLSFGNIIGANILNLTLITGIIILVAHGLKIKSSDIKKEAVWMALICISPLILFLIGNYLSRIDGIILLSLFAFYSYYLVLKKGKYERKKGKLTDNRNVKETFFVTIFFCVLLLILFYSAKYVVKYASLIALDLSLPKIIVGLFLISFGTTLPELIFGIRAAQLGHGDMALGDQLGTIISNSTLILGVVALIHPIQAAFSPFLISAIFLAFSSIIFAYFYISGKKFTIKEGILLILVYVVFVIIQFYLRG